MDEIRGLYETNVFGLFRVTQAVIPKMKAKKSGHIINVSSIAGLLGKFMVIHRVFHQNVAILQTLLHRLSRESEKNVSL